jgi:hypothetical protein
MMAPTAEVQEVPRGSTGLDNILGGVLDPEPMYLYVAH